MVSPVPSWAVPSPVGQGLQGDGEDHRGGQAAVVGQPTGVQALEQGAERQAAVPVGGHAGRRSPGPWPDRWRCPVPAGVGGGGGERLQVGLQAGGDGVGHGGGDVRGPVAATGEVQPGQGVGPLLGPLHRPAFLVLADLGCDDVEDPPAEPGQVGGPELVGVLDQPPLGQLGDLDTDVGGQSRPGR